MSQPSQDFLHHLEAFLQERKRTLPEGSYTAKLLSGKPAQIYKKVVEEAGETALALMQNDHDEAVSESADLLFHLVLSLVHRDISLDEVLARLEERHRP